jgi:hypothetical protein
MYFFRRDLTRTRNAVAVAGEKPGVCFWFRKSRGSSAHPPSPAANAQVKKLLAGLRACEERYLNR